MFALPPVWASELIMYWNGKLARSADAPATAALLGSGMEGLDMREKPFDQPRRQLHERIRPVWLRPMGKYSAQLPVRPPCRCFLHQPAYYFRLTKMSRGFHNHVRDEERVGFRHGHWPAPVEMKFAGTFTA